MRTKYRIWLEYFLADTDADMIFVKNNQSRTKATTVIENVDIECIPLLATFCKKEFYTQRKEILEQINQIDFSTIWDDFKSDFTWKWK